MGGEAEHRGDQVGRELADHHIQFRDGVVVHHPGETDILLVLADAGHGVGEHLVRLEVRIGLGYGGEACQDIHDGVFLLGNLPGRDIGRPAGSDDIGEGVMLVSGILLGHLNEVGKGVPPGLELDIDLSEGVLHLLLEADERALGPDDVEDDDYHKGRR